MKPEEVAAWLAGRDSFLLVTHRNPDGDTMGSAAALCSALRRAGKTAYLFPNKQVTEKLLPFVQPCYAPAGYSPEYTVSVDVATEKMFADGFSGNVDLSIDHHPSNSHYAPEACICGERAACGEIVLQVITALCGELTKEEADLLYIALSTDCGCFQYANTDAHALLSAAALVTAGADNARLNQLFFRKVSIPRIKLEGLIYANMSFHRDGKVVVAIVTDEMIAEAGATEDDCDDLAGLAPNDLGVRGRWHNTKGTKPITEGGFRSSLKTLGSRYGIPPEVMHPHSFRHRFAIEFLKRKNDIALLADLLGHSRIDMTRIYLRQSQETPKDAVNEAVDW